MHALVYRNTKTTLPGWVPIHDGQPRGVAYETDTHFVHFYGVDTGLHIFSTGLTVTEQKSGSLQEWVIKTFGALEINQANTVVGHTIEGVWRPGLYYDDEVLQGLKADNVELRLAEQAVFLLVQRLDELLLFVEPSPNTLSTHSHKARELLILASTEIEAEWKHHLRCAGVKATGKDFNTNDYVRLRQPLFLDEFEVMLPRYKHVPAVRPFLGWSNASPTQSLPWYDAYNKTKHDRSTNFEAASLGNCISAVAASLVLFAVRFGPYRLYGGGGSLSTLFNQTFAMTLVAHDPKSAYVAKIKIPSNQRGDLICFDSRKMLEPRNVDSLVV